MTTKRDIVFGKVLFQLSIINLHFFHLCLQNTLTIQLDYLIKYLLQPRLQVSRHVAGEYKLHKWADICPMVGIPNEELVVIKDELDQRLVDLFHYLGEDEAEEEMRVCVCDLLEDLLYVGSFFIEFFDDCLQDGL